MKEELRETIDNNDYVQQQDTKLMLDHNSNGSSENDQNIEVEDKTLAYQDRKPSNFVLSRQGSSHPLYFGKNTIGRDASNDVIVNNPYVSRQHATIVVSDEEIEVLNHSSNGTYINRESVICVIVKTGDEISIAGVNYLLEEVVEVKHEVLIAQIANELAYVHSQSKFHSNSKLNRNQSGFSLIELLIVIVILGIISSISVLNITSSRRAANSASAIQSLRVIASSQASYSTGVGNGEYASSEDLLKQQYIDDSIAAASLPTPNKIKQQPKSGYLFIFDITRNNSTTNTIADYEISARPLLGTGVARAGDKSFFLDSTGVIKFSPSALAPFADSSSQPLN